MYTLNEVKAYLAEVLQYCKDHCIDPDTPRDTEKEEAAKQHYQNAYDSLVEALEKIPTFTGSTLSKLLMQHYTYIAITGDKLPYNYRTLYEYSVFNDIMETSKPSWFQGLVETDIIVPWCDFESQAGEGESNYSSMMSRFQTPINDFAFRCMYAAKENIPQPGGSDMDNDKYYQLQYIECGAYELIKAFELPIYTRDWDRTPDPTPEPESDEDDGEDEENPPDEEP